MVSAKNYKPNWDGDFQAEMARLDHDLEVRKAKISQRIEAEKRECYKGLERMRVALEEEREERERYSYQYAKNFYASGEEPTIEQIARAQQEIIKHDRQNRQKRYEYAKHFYANGGEPTVEQIIQAWRVMSDEP
jgi:hypothetical protein